MPRVLRRYSGMFKVALQDALQSRSTALLWFLYAMINTMSALLLWVAGFSNKSIVGTVSLPYIQMYYLLMLVANSSLMSHIEESVARYDIKEGALVKYLIKPVSYFWYHFFTELPWRILGGFFAIMGLIVFVPLLKLHFTFPQPTVLPLVAVTIFLTIILSYTYKITLSLTAFWLTEGWALFEVMEAMVIIVAGYVMPLSFFPPLVQKIAFSLPFAYMIYLPVQALAGQLNALEIVRGIGMQILWIAIFAVLYRFLWKRGLARFTGVGQ